MNIVREINKINERELDLGGTGSWHDDYKDSAYIFIGGLPRELTEGDVITIFSQYGEVMDVNIPRDKETGKTRGFGFLMYEDQRSTVLAVDNLNGAKVLERTLRVDHVKNYKQPKTKGEDGEWQEREEQSFNAKPEVVIDDNAASESSDSSGPSIDPEDPMRDYLLAKRKEEKALKRAKRSKPKSKSKGKHKDETPEERHARKEQKKRRKQQVKSEGMRGVEALLSTLGTGGDRADRRRSSASPDRRSRSRSRTPHREFDRRVRYPADDRRGHSRNRSPPRSRSRSPPPRRSPRARPKDDMRATRYDGSDDRKTITMMEVLHQEGGWHMIDATSSQLTPTSAFLSHGSRDLAHRRHISENGALYFRDASGLHTRDDCEPANPLNTLTDRLNTLLNSSGPGYILPLCPSTQYYIQAPILFFSPDQEISTVGYPTGEERATLVVAGPVADGQGHTTAVDGTCENCSGVKLRYVQINGTRQGAPPTNGGANIEMGGSNSGQLIEYVHSFDPRSWSCLHVAEGALSCNNVTIQNNDIGPCGSDAFQQWADGISVSCQNSLVRNNMVNNPTDVELSLFGSPGTLVENNTVWVETMTLLGGINMVDYDPWNGNYTNTIVRNNLIRGGFATDMATAGETKGVNDEDAIIKIGIAIGPRTWFGDRYFNNVSTSGTVLNNQLTGAFGYGIAMSSAENFTVEGNVLVGNTSFIETVQASTTQSDFQSILDGNSLTCIVPPDGGDFWPFGGNPSSTQSGSTPLVSSSSSPSASSALSSGLSPGGKAGVAIGVIVGIAALVALTFFIRKWAIRRAAARHAPSEAWIRSGYTQNREYY
ncbi:hypothetical protein A0H81_09669 [Grifola frondosa]|uniref:RRM domain-containing protein n=1 Tax=Grifola frondosa TaxID=5627 RepID=A0A1C7M0X0_GRIFR|nr:hypothetical protein A0H81_09669 [Grifola frondosa]